MKKLFNKAVSDPLISGSAIVFLGTFVGNIFNFLFNFFMTRNLSITDYGTLASLASVVLLFALAADSFIPTVVHFSSSYFARKEVGKIAALFWKLNIFFVVSGGIILGTFVILGKQIGYFFKINDSFLMFLLGVIVFFASLMTLNRGILTGVLSFRFISFFHFISSVLKFLLGVLLVWWGFGVVGGLLAFLIAYVFQYLFSFFPLRFIFQNKTKETVVGIKNIIAYGAPSALAMLGLTLFITTDIVLVKHFYSSQEAGIYAGMSLLGRIIYFFSSPISTVLFPLVVQRHTRNESHSNLFFIAIFLVGVSSLCITVFYYIYPEFSILLLLKQKEYLAIKSMLWIFGFFMVLYSLLWVATNYFLSIKKTNVFIPIIIAAIFQALALWFFHGTFLTVIVISMMATSFPLFSILLYYWRTHDTINAK